MTKIQNLHKVCIEQGVTNEKQMTSTLEFQGLFYKRFTFWNTEKEMTF